MGYIKFFKLLFQNLFVDFAVPCDSSLGGTAEILNHPTFLPKVEPPTSKDISVSKRRPKVVLSSNNMRSIRTISRRNRRNNRRPAMSTPKRKAKLIFDTSTEGTDISMAEEQQYHHSLKPVVYKSRGRKDRNYNYKRYLARLLHKINSESQQSNLTISSNAMECMSNFMADIFDKIATEAGQLVQKNKTKTLSASEINSAVRIVMPGELGRHANLMADKKLKNMNCQYLKL